MKNEMIEPTLFDVGLAATQQFSFFWTEDGKGRLKEIREKKDKMREELSDICAHAGPFSAEKLSKTLAKIYDLTLIELFQICKMESFFDEYLMENIEYATSLHHNVSAEFIKSSDGIIVIKLGFPYIIRKKNHAKNLSYEHSSHSRIALKYELNRLLSEEKVERFSSININFLFAYPAERTPIDHDNLAVSGIIDEICKALHIDDNGVLCSTHYSSTQDSSISSGAYIFITSQKIAPMSMNNMLAFLSKSV